MPWLVGRPEAAGAAAEEWPPGQAALAARDLAALGTALGFPRRPDSGALQEMWARLPTRSIPELPSFLWDFDLEKSKLPALKALCRACALPVSGAKEALCRRLHRQRNAQRHVLREQGQQWRQAPG